MKEDMPGGTPRWVGNIPKSGLELENLFGFIHAVIICPDHLDKPFLPYKMPDGT